MPRDLNYKALFLVPLVLALALPLLAADDPVVFKSDVAMSRADAQVVDSDGRAITGLQVRDFVLRLNGRVVPIRNFASENMPIDILLLLDVSGSMRPHVERIAYAAQQALNVLAEKDRVGIMVFSNWSHVRLPFRSSHSEITGELNHLIRSEGFNGGTRITHAMLDAARYVEQNARPEARRAIVILTDDMTQDEENEPQVESALARANAVLSFLQAQYEVPGMAGGGRPHGTWGSNGGGGGWPGGVGFPGGGPVILGRGGPGGYGGVDPSHTAGTAQIAQDSGGDTMSVDEASALEDTLARLRQRYALYFYLPEGMTAADRQNLQIDLAEQARLRFHDAEIHYRRVYMSGGSSSERNGPTAVTHAQPSDPNADPAIPSDSSTPKGRRVAVNDDSTPRVNTIDPDSNSNQQSTSPSTQSGQASQGTSQSSPTQNSPSGTQSPQSGGWPRANPQKPPPQ